MIFESFAEKEFRWLPDLGIGFYQYPDLVYNDNCDLWDKINLVNSYTKLDVLDINVGNVEFVMHRENTYGHDLSDNKTDWLIQSKQYRHPFKGSNSITFWDTLQKIQDPRLHLSGAKEYVFISCPIYKNIDDIDRYNDYWYFTSNGLLIFMEAFGFKVVESKIGHNHGIFVFEKFN